MAAVLNQALPAPQPVPAAGPWTNPYQAQLEAATSAYNAPQAPAYTPEQVAQRQAANQRAQRWGVLGLMMGDEGQQKAGGAVLQQALQASAPRVTDRGTYDPTTGQMTVNPEFAREQAQTRMERLQDLAARSQESHDTLSANQQFQQAQLQAQLAERLQAAQLQREGINAQKEIANNQRKSQMAGQMFDDWQKINKQDLDVRNSFQNLMSTPQSAEGDVSFIYQYMKMLDPGSVVREGEFATAQNAAGVPDRIRNLFNQTLNGARLNPDQRTQMIATASGLNSQADTRIGQRNKYFTSRASNAGIDPSWVIPEYGGSRATDEAVSAAMPKPGGTPAAPGGAAAPASGNRPRVTDAASYAALPPGAVYIDPNGNVKTKGQR